MAETRELKGGEDIFGLADAGRMSDSGGEAGIPLWKPGVRFPRVLKTNRRMKMKKKIILALGLAAAVAAVAVPAFAGFHSHEPREGNGVVCSLCKGTGRSPGPQGPGTGIYQCSWCKGTGFSSGY